MAVKRIDYTVYKGGTITPLDIQDGGLQGEHRATILRFTIEDGWYNNLRTQTDGYRLIYHFESYDGAGGKHCSDTAVLTEKWVEYPLENFLTRYGGLVKVTLVFSLVNIETGTCEREQHSFSTQLRLIFAPHANTDGDEYESMASLAETAKANKQLTEKYANEAKEAQAGTEAAASVLRQGTTFVFNGGAADGAVGADLIIDGEMSDYSSNPVQNKVIKGYADKKDKELSDKIDSLYPVGSVWIGGKDKNGNVINPTNIFGGTWQLIDKGFKNARYYVNDETELKNYFNGNDSGAKVNILHLEYSGNNITVTINSTTLVNYGDVSHPLLIFKMPNSDTYDSLLGVISTTNASGGYENIIYPHYIIGSSDSGRSVCILRAQTHTITGLIEIFHHEVIPNGDLSTGSDIEFTFTMNFLPKNMRDTFCDKFYWQRTE